MAAASLFTGKPCGRQQEKKLVGKSCADKGVSFKETVMLRCGNECLVFQQF